MRITYDVKLPERNRFRGDLKSEEVAAIEAFLQGAQKNMCFSYDDEKDAKRKLNTIRDWQRRVPEGDLIDKFRNGSRIFIIRLSPKEVNERKAARKEATT